jgi:hypothetical protein
MIRSCRDKDVRRLLEQKFSRRLQSIEKSAIRFRAGFLSTERLSS